MGRGTGGAREGRREVASNDVGDEYVAESESTAPFDLTIILTVWL